VSHSNDHGCILQCTAKNWLFGSVRWIVIYFSVLAVVLGFCYNMSLCTDYSINWYFLLLSICVFILHKYLGTVDCCSKMTILLTCCFIRCHIKLLADDWVMSALIMEIPVLHCVSSTGKPTEALKRCVSGQLYCSVFSVFYFLMHWLYFVWFLANHMFVCLDGSIWNCSQGISNW